MCKDHPNFAHTFALSKKKKSSADHELCLCAIYAHYSCPFSLMRNAILNELCAKHKLLARQYWCWRPKHGPAYSAMAKRKKNCESHCLYWDHILSLQLLVLTSVSRNVLFSCMTIFVTSDYNLLLCCRWVLLEWKGKVFCELRFAQCALLRIRSQHEMFQYCWFWQGSAAGLFCALHFAVCHGAHPGPCTA